MKRYLITLLYSTLLTILATFSGFAQSQFSDSLRFSLLTCSAGPQVYERFGHTGLRVVDLKNGYDIVFHYGVFSFNKPNFMYRFIKGETDYSIGAVPTRLFVDDYQHRGLRMTEQVLALTPDDSQRTIDMLVENYKPENRIYRYNFFFDNCATRVYHLINKGTLDAVQYDSTAFAACTLRDMLIEKTGRNTWLDFGISLVIAGRADQTTTFVEKMFLPEYLMKAYKHATITDSLSARSLVAQEQILLDGRADCIPEYTDDTYSPCGPVAVAWGLLVLTLMFTLTLRKRHPAVLKTYDVLWLLTCGVAGVIVWFLCLVSEHPATSYNWNCLWLWPSHLVIIALLWIKKTKNIVNSYFFINFASLILYLSIGYFIEQHVHAAFIPLVLALAIRAYDLANLPLPGQCKHSDKA